MMKKTFLIMMIVCSSYFAQDYLPLEIGNVWKYSTYDCVHGDCFYSTKTVRVVSDTVINNRKYFRIKNWFFRDEFFYRSDTTGLYFVITDSTKGTQPLTPEYLLLDFNLELDSMHYIGYYDWFIRLKNRYMYTYFENSPNKSTLEYKVDVWPYYYPLHVMEDIGIIWYTQIVPPIGDHGGHLEGCIISGTPYGIYTDVKDIEENVPEVFFLLQNYPNPFNPSTRIKYQVASIEKVSLKVYDVLGREIKTLINKQLQPGEYEVEFDGSDLPSGVYLYRLSAGEFSQARKMLLIK